MESIKSYFEIVFLIFILLSSIFIGFKILVLIIEIKRVNKKILILDVQQNRT